MFTAYLPGLNPGPGVTACGPGSQGLRVSPTAHPLATLQRRETTLQEKQRTEVFLKYVLLMSDRGPTADGQAGEPEQLLPDLGEVAWTAFPNYATARPQAPQKQTPSEVPFISRCPFRPQPPECRPRAISGAASGGRGSRLLGISPSLPLPPF